MINWLLRHNLPFKDIGWTEIGEVFTRFTVMQTRWFTVYLHRLYAPIPHPNCHDHPWAFVTFILAGGYFEYHDGKTTWRGPGRVLHRPAEFSHNVHTRGLAWSLVIAGPKKREWGFHDC